MEYPRQQLLNRWTQYCYVYPTFTDFLFHLFTAFAAGNGAADMNEMNLQNHRASSKSLGLKDNLCHQD
jgi:hypothetical protein